MAEMNQVSIEDESAAERWSQRVEDLNRQMKAALIGLKEDLETVGDGAEGELVQQFIDTATEVYQHTNEILTGMNGLLDVVHNVLRQFKERIGKSFDEAGAKIRDLFNQ